MTTQTYVEGLTDEINENKIKLIEYLDEVDMSEMVKQNGKYYHSDEASIVLEEFLAEKE